MAKQHTDNIKNRCAWFKDLVAAVFVSSVKILSAVRLSKDTKKLSVKLPTNEVSFTCWQERGAEFYKDLTFLPKTSPSILATIDYTTLRHALKPLSRNSFPYRKWQMHMTMQNDEIMNPGDMDMTQDDVDEYDGPPPRNRLPWRRLHGGPMEDVPGPLGCGR